MLRLPLTPTQKCFAFLTSPQGGGNADGMYLTRHLAKVHPNKNCYASAFAGLLLVLALSACAAAPGGDAKLLADDGAEGDSFGFSVALFGDTAIIGAFRDDHVAGVDAGSAYVFTRSGNLWRQQAKLTAIDGAANDNFGGKVVLSGDTAVIGAIFHDEKGDNSGAAYVFTRAGTAWRQQVKLTATDTAQGDAFGQSLALAGDTVVIGAPHDDDKGDGSGSVYVFTRAGTVWRQQAKLNAADGAEGDVFGISVALAGDTILVGADLNDEKAVDAGAVYVFTRSGNTWSQQAKLTAKDGAEIDIFGVRVALSGDTALISARRDDDDVMGVDAGSAYIFIRTDTTWRQQAKLTAADGAADDRFGRDVALAGDTAVIGAMFQDDKGENAGSAYVFARTGSSWNEQAKLTAADGAEGDVFGFSIALSGDTAVIGAARSDDKGAETGSAYIFNINRD